MKKIVFIGGGLGNQMFHYAYLLSLRELKGIKNSEEVMGNYTLYCSDLNGESCELKKIFKIELSNYKLYLFDYLLKIKTDSFIRRRLIKVIKASYLFFYKILSIFNLNCYFENWNDSFEKKEKKKSKKIHLGYYQSEKFFKKIENKIRKTYTFPKVIDEKNKNILEKIHNCESVSLHIRRGDYLEYEVLNNLAPMSYYESAIEFMKLKIKNPVFFIFSDDIEWCKENFKLDNCYYIDWNKGEENYRDMQLMSLCKHNIIPNSTFSWWGAWLNNNPNKIVIAPEKWFNDCANMKYSDIIPETWIKIKNY